MKLLIHKNLLIDYNQVPYYVNILKFYVENLFVKFYKKKIQEQATSS